MIILDTNVLSETQRIAPDARVLDWLDAQAARSLFITAVTVAELRFGIAALPDGRRKTALHAVFSTIIEQDFQGRILSFDARAADVYGTRLAEARRAGLVVGMADAQIAAIALTTGYTVATRDTAPYKAMGVPYLNPWTGSD